MLVSRVGHAIQSHGRSVVGPASIWGRPAACVGMVHLGLLCKSNKEHPALGGQREELGGSECLPTMGAAAVLSARSWCAAKHLQTNQLNHQSLGEQSETVWILPYVRRALEPIPFPKMRTTTPSAATLLPLELCTSPTIRPLLPAHNQAGWNHLPFRLTCSQSAARADCPANPLLVSAITGYFTCTCR